MQNVAGWPAVLQSIFLVEGGDECLVDLCIRDVRIVCHQSVLEKLLQGLVVTNGVFHCVECSRKGRFFSEWLPTAAVRLAMRRRLFGHMWALASSQRLSRRIRYFRDLACPDKREHGALGRKAGRRETDEISVAVLVQVIGTCAGDSSHTLFPASTSLWVFR